MKAIPSGMEPIDYRTAFDLAPVGLVLSRQRQILDCNQQLLDMFSATRAQLVGRSLEVLYPSSEEFERTGARIAAQLNSLGWYADERVMKRLGASLGARRTWGVDSEKRPQRGQFSPSLLPHHPAMGQTDGEKWNAAVDSQPTLPKPDRRLGGELFWCHVSGRALNAAQPHAAGIWSFEDLSSRRPVRADMTPREREISALLIEGLTSKLIGKRLAISPRTVDVYRSRLMKKLGAATTPELVNKLLSS